MTPAITALERADIPYTVHEYVHVSDDARGFGLEAADKLGLDPFRVFKTLVVVVDEVPVIAILPVGSRLAPKQLARALGGKRAELCRPDVAERVTGYVVGGISPLGQKRPLTTVIDETATLWETIYVSGGRRGLDVEIASQALIEHLAAVVADIVDG